MNVLTERLADLTQAQFDFVQIANQLDAKKRDQPGVCGAWSPKDVAAHLTGWDQLLLQFITDSENFVPPDDIDRFNQQSVQRRKDIGWPDVLQEMGTNFRHLQAAVAATTPEMAIHDRVFSWLAGRIEDYVLHRDQLAAWVT